MSPVYAGIGGSSESCHPPAVDPIEFMEKRIKWRYAKGVPSKTDSFVFLGDSTIRLRHVQDAGQLDYFFRQRPCYSHRRPTAELPITITINGCGYGFLVANQTHSRFAVAIKASLQISKNLQEFASVRV